MKHMTRRAALNLLPFLVSGAVAPAVRAKPEVAPGAASFVGQLLVATPVMGDPRFAQTVILLARHNATGALGLIVNRPIGWRPIAALLQSIGQSAAGVMGQVRVFAGGPVQPDAGIVLHSEDYQRPGTIDIDGEVAMTSTPEIFQDIAHHRGPAKSLIAFGYAGWGPGQLEGELTLGAWAMCPDDPRLVFDEDRADVWGQASRLVSPHP